MITSKLNPWNWFKKEHEQDKTLPVRRTAPAHPAAPLDQFHAEFDRMVEAMFTNFGLPAPGGMPGMSDAGFEAVAIKPKVNVYGTDKEYVVEAELPGVEEKDLSVELEDGVLVLSAEKRYEEKTEDKGYYRMERSSGSFRRVLNIPDDADTDNISAKLSKGVLCVTMPRTGSNERRSRKIAIGS